MSPPILEMMKLWISSLTSAILLESGGIVNLTSSQELSCYIMRKKLIFKGYWGWMVSWAGDFSPEFCVMLKT